MPWLSIFGGIWLAMSSPARLDGCYSHLIGRPAIVYTELGGGYGESEQTTASEGSAMTRVEEESVTLCWQGLELVDCR